jgi:glycosyltransferase involved in cell wall biosynthesis
VGRPAVLNGASPALAGQAARSGGAILYRGPAELAAAAAALLDDPDRGATLGACGRRFVEDRYRWAAVLEGVTALVDEAERRAALRGG